MNTNLEEVSHKTISYNKYYEEVAQMVEEKRTSGEVQSQSLIDFTRLNFSRMRRLTKTARPSQELVTLIDGLGKKFNWIVITEAWCGDAAQNIPFIANLADACKNVDLGLVYRDENPDFMDKYLTNGGRSIPKLVVFDAHSGEELAVWGPRPSEVQKMVLENNAKGENKLPYEAFGEIVHKWYNSNRNQLLEKELFAIFRNI
jgi:hypothetical protein